MYHTLSELPVGSAARVKSLHTDGGIRRRLLDIGLIEGTDVRCLYESPSGDPAAYLIRGAVIALRSEDSASIEVEEAAVPAADGLEV